MNEIRDLFLSFIICGIARGNVLENINWQNFSLEDFVTREEKVLHLSGSSTSSYVLNKPPTNNRISINNGGTAAFTSEVSKEVDKIKQNNQILIKYYAVKFNHGQLIGPNAEIHTAYKNKHREYTVQIEYSTLKLTDKVSETDLYLLGAIEKLVYKIDLLDQRLKRAEELLQHVMEGSNIKRQDPCPANFTRVTQYCYHFNERQYNWKSANSMCKSLGGNLAEFESNEEYKEIIAFILSESTIRGHDFWTGGLNPGLLWIWSNSARPVVPKNSSLPEDTIVGPGRCLKLAYTGSANIYSYNGAECSIRLRFICEHEENLTIRALKRIHKALKINN